MQDLAFGHQLRAEHRFSVDQGLRLFGTYEQHYDAAVRLEQDAPSVLRSDRTLAQRMTRQSQHERALAADVLRYLGVDPSYDDRSGLPSVDAAAAIRGAESEDRDLANLRASPNARLATTARDKATNLVGVAVILAASLLFLTLAQLTTQATSRGFAFAGSVVAGAALVVFTMV